MGDKQNQSLKSLQQRLVETGVRLSDGANYSLNSLPPREYA